MSSSSGSLAAQRPPAGVDQPDRAGEATGSRIPAWAGWLLIISLWLIARPYRGVRHDGVLYLGQTLAHLMPRTIGQDVFFVSGSQDRYSLFSAVMAPLVRHLGVGASQIAMLFVAEAGFLAACWMLAAGIPSRLLRWCAMLSLAALPHVYGGAGAFAFAEPFLTARVLSEPFAVLALACLLRGRLGWTAVALVASALMHPLIALPTIAVCWLYLVLADRRWTWALLVLVVPLVAGAAGVAPFDALWHRYDAQWWPLVHVANARVFLASMATLDWAPTVLDAGVLVLAARLFAGRPLGRLARAALGCAVALLAACALGADVVHDVLVTQLQLWRVLWLTHLLSLLLLPVLLADAWRRGSVGRWAAWAAVFAALAVNSNMDNGWLTVAWAACAWIAARRDTPVSAGVVRLAIAGSVAGSLVVTAVTCRTTLQVVDQFTDRFDGAGVVQVVLGLSLCCAVVGGLALLGLGATGRWRAITMAVVAALAVGASLSWDQRSDWQRFVENGLENPDPPFAREMPPNARVYWESGLFESWMLARRPDFFATEQGAGLLFNRQTAVDYFARRKIMAPLAAKKEICTQVGAILGGDADDPDACAPDLADIQALCAEPGAPDIVVLSAGSTKPRGATATWAYAPRDPVHPHAYRLYDCARLK